MFIGKDCSGQPADNGDRNQIGADEQADKETEAGLVTVAGTDTGRRQNAWTGRYRQKQNGDGKCQHAGAGAGSRRALSPCVRPAGRSDARYSQQRG